MRVVGRAWNAFFQTASFARMLVEVGSLAAALTLMVVTIYGPVAESLYALALLFFINPICALYYALRLQPARGGRIKQVLLEIVRLSVVAMIINLISFAQRFWMAPRLMTDSDLVLWSTIIAGLLIFPFFFFRTLSRLAVWWGGMRERHLIWSLMNSHLVAVGLLQALVLVPLFMIMLFTYSNEWIEDYIARNPMGQFLYRLNIIMPLVGLSILAAMSMLIVMLPASAVVSYFLARRLRRRLEALIDAAHAARDGNYQARVPVTGADEIATLQRDFNAMIANLESKVNGLRAEREKVTALLTLRHELMANVSHELRTPLATMRAYLEAGQIEEQSPLTLEASEVNILQREMTTLQLMIDDLFALSRAETDHLSLHIELVDVSSLIAQLVETVAPLAWRVNRIQVSFQSPLGMPPVLADATRLTQALRNLVHNSLRHTLPGGLVMIRVSQQNQVAEIQVLDTGSGIAAEDLPRIWDRFYRDAANGGTGLGLTLVKSFVEGMGGQIAVESVVGEGTCFTLTLPLSEDSEILPRPQAAVPMKMTPL